MEKYQIIVINHWKVFLKNDDQTYLGRCVVVCQEKVSSMSDLNQEQWLDFANVVKKLETAAKRVFGATMCNWTCLMNLAYENNPPNPQVHWHYRPRYDHVVNFAGEVFEDKAFGHHYERGTNRKVSDQLAGKIVEALQKGMK